MAPIDITERGTHHAIVRRVLDADEIDGIRRLGGSEISVAEDGRRSEVCCFGVNEVPGLEGRVRAVINAVAADRGWRPLASESVWCDAQRCVYPPGGHFDWHLDDDAGGSGGLRRISFVMLLSSSFEGGGFAVDRDDEEVLPLDVGDCVIFEADRLWHKVAAVTSGARETLVLAAFDER